MAKMHVTLFKKEQCYVKLCFVYVSYNTTMVMRQRKLDRDWSHDEKPLSVFLLFLSLYTSSSCQTSSDNSLSGKRSEEWVRFDARDSLFPVVVGVAHLSDRLIVWGRVSDGTKVFPTKFMFSFQSTGLGCRKLKVRKSPRRECSC